MRGIFVVKIGGRSSSIENSSVVTDTKKVSFNIISKAISSIRIWQAKLNEVQFFFQKEMYYKGFMFRAHFGSIGETSKFFMTDMAVHRKALRLLSLLIKDKIKSNGGE